MPAILRHGLSAYGGLRQRESPRAATANHAVRSLAWLCLRPIAAARRNLIKWVLGLLTVVLAALALEDKGRQVAGNAREAYGEAADQARVATKTLSRNVDRQPLSALLVASVLGYVLARLLPRR